jgi:branched-chain amino acid transport system substrate-binding protein
MRDLRLVETLPPQEARIPTMAPGIYSAVKHYIAAIAAAGTDDAKAVMVKMRDCR